MSEAILLKQASRSGRSLASPRFATAPPLDVVQKDGGDWRQPASAGQQDPGLGNFSMELSGARWETPSDAICASRMQTAFRLWECSLPLRKAPLCLIPFWKTLSIGTSLSLFPA